MATRTRDLKVVIDAEVARFEAGFERARRSTMRLEDQLRKADLAAAQLDKQLADEAKRAADKRAADMEKLGRGLTAFGVATAAGLALATKAAIDWESAWAGVTKTVDGTPEQMAALESELRDLATTLPAAHAEIAGVAEAAGQLGVQRDAVAAFTKTMIDLSETTNLTADEAATSIAQLGNVLRLDLKNDVDNFGAALVALGNDGASTEADILSMAQRIGGAGATIGLSAQDVLGFAAALSNVGIEAEAGGSAISRVMVDIATAVDQGGDELDTFAKTAGMSSQEFVRAFEADPARAIASFIQGLGGVEAAGGSVFATLERLGLSEIRVRDALLRLSNSTRGVATDLDLSGEAWSDNTALIEEARKRYETTEAKIQLAKNALVDMAIDIGGVVLPVVADLAEGVAGLARWFTDLPGPVKVAITVLGTVAGATALAAGGFLLLAPRIAAAQVALLGLARTAPVAYGALATLGPIGLALGALGALVTGVVAVNNALKDTGPTASEATKALLDLREGATKTAFHDIVDEMVETGDRLEFFANRYSNFTGEVSDGSAEAEQAFQSMQEKLQGFDDALVGLVEGGNPDLAASMFEDMAAVLAERLGVSLDEVKTALPDYAAALENLDNQQRVAAQSAGEFGDAAGAIPGQTVTAEQALEELATRFGVTGDDAAKAAQEMLEEWASAIGEFVSITEAYDTVLSAKEEREQTTAQATADATGDQSDSWEDFAGDVTVTVDEYLAELERMVANQENWRANMVLLAGRVSDEMLGYLASLGPEGADEVALMAQMTDAELQRAEALWRQSTQEGVDGIVDEIANSGPILRQIAAKHGQDVANNIRDYMIRNKVGVATAAAALGVAIDQNIPDSHNTQTTVSAPPKSNLQSVLQTIRNHFSGVTVPLTVGQPGFGVLGGSGGSGGPAAGAGGWAPPMRRGTYSVGSPFGMRNGRLHTGQDLPARTGTPIFAARAGRVSRAMTMSGSYGNHVYIDHGGGWQTRYAHMSSRFVRAGQSIGGGHRIGQVGSTGNSTGPHLHFEIRSGGRALNPKNYLRFARGGPIEGPGGPRDDQVPIWASNGEYMHNAAAVRHYGRDFMHAVNNMEFPKYWTGGPIGTVPASGVGGARVVNVSLVFSGPVGSQRELQNWLTESLDSLRRSGRWN